MEMKRRAFLQGLIAAAVVPVVVIKWLAVDVPQKVYLACRSKKYPGGVVPLNDISGPAKWSG